MNGIPPPADRVRLRILARRPSLRARIRRRAREIAMIECERFVDAMIAEIYLGRLDEGLIEWWRPVWGYAPILEKLYAAISEKRKEN